MLKVITLHLNTEIYSEQAISSAAQAFSGLCYIDIVHTDTAWIVNLSDCRYGEERTAAEYENYLIGLENI